MTTNDKVSDDCLEHFQALKLSQEYKYIIYAVNKAADTEILVEHAAGADKSTKDALAELREKLPKADGRYAVFNFEYGEQDALHRKICFIYWLPEDTKMRQKMIYASNRASLRNTLQGVSREIDAEDLSDIENDAILKKCLSP